jgi:hypothetical protein
MLKIITSLVLISTVASVVTPALALDGCGRNAHRNASGVCTYGGQNQNYCLVTTGRRAVQVSDGTWRCIVGE